MRFIIPWHDNFVEDILQVEEDENLDLLENSEDYKHENLTDEEIFHYLEYPEEFGNKPKEVRTRIIMNELMSMFYFHLFSNLTSLTLYGPDLEEKSFPLGSFIVDSFASLKKLKCLVLSFYTRPKGTRFISVGLLELPSLQSFSFEMSFVRNEEWNLLWKFMNKQTDLFALKLAISLKTKSLERTLEQNKRMDKTILCLKYLPKLRQNLFKCKW